MRKQFEALADLNFKKIDGGYVFFPNGGFGAGYHVGEEQKGELHGFITRLYFIVVAFAFVVVLFNSWVAVTVFHTLFAVAICIALLAAYYYVGLTRRLKGLPRSNERLTRTDSRLSAARVIQATSTGSVYFMLAVGILMTALGIFVTFIGLWKGNQNEFLIGAASIVFFGAGLVLAIIQFRRKRSGQRP